MTAETAIEIGVLVALVVSPTILMALAGRAWVHQQEDRRTLDGYTEESVVGDVIADDTHDDGQWVRDSLRDQIEQRKK